MPYVNIPHTSNRFVDGNLRTLVRNNDPITLVIGRALKGQTNALYQVTDSGTAGSEFGGSSEILRGIIEAESAGSSNIFAIRVPGKSSFFEKLGAEQALATTDGISILPALESSEAGSRYGVAYRAVKNFDNTSTGGAATGTKTSGQLVIVDLVDNVVVHSSDADTCSYTEYDLAAVDVVRGALDEADVAPATAETMVFTFETTSTGGAVSTATLGDGNDWTIPVSGFNIKFEEENGDTVTDLATKFAAQLTASPLGSVFTITQALGVVTMTADGTTDSSNELVYPSTFVTTLTSDVLQTAPATFRANSTYLPVSANFSGYAARPYVSDSISLTLASTGAAVAFAGAAEWSVDYNVAVRDIGQFPVSVAQAFSSVGGGVFVPLEDVLGEYASQMQYDPTVFGTGATVVVPDDLRSSYYAGQTGASTSFMQLYEQLHQVFEFLQFRSFNIVLPQGIYLNTPNYADGDTSTAGVNVLGVLDEAGIEALLLTSADGDAYTVGATLLDGLLGTVEIEAGDLVVWNGITSLWEQEDARDSYPAAGSDNDILGYLAIEETDDFDFTYYWDVDGDGIAELSSSGKFSEDASTLGGLTYREVNFGHQVALFIHEASEDFQNCHAMVPVTLPKGLAPRTLARYFGKEPTYTYDPALGYNVIASSSDDGSGILGYKLVGGRSDFRGGQQGGGIILTTSKWFDDGAEVLDSNDTPVDLGKYISKVDIFGRTRNAFNNSSTGYLTNGANIYGGMVSTLPPGVAPTGLPMTALTMDYHISASKADVLAGAGLVTLFSEEGNATIADAPTGALPNSDYRRLLTVRVLNLIVQEIRRVSRPFLGKGQTTNRTLSLQQGIAGVLQQQTGPDQPLEDSSFVFSQTAAERVLGCANVSLDLDVVNELRRIKLSTSLQG